MFVLTYFLSAFSFDFFLEHCLSDFFFFFFFQAEDGIRDTSVTGVQTCALPIYSFHYSPSARVNPSASNSSAALYGSIWRAATRSTIAASSPGFSRPRSNRSMNRSEERRVGKECRSRRAQ